MYWDQPRPADLANAGLGWEDWGLVAQSSVTSPQEVQPSLWEQGDLPQVPPSPSPASQSPNSPSPTTLLILDTETTGLEPASAQCIEVGAVLFQVPQRAVLAQVSFLLPAQANPAEAINGIPAAVTRLVQPWRAGLEHFKALLAAADAVLAHNAGFDAQWFGRDPLPAINKPWICSMEDIRWPAERQLRGTPSVRDLALAYGVPVWAAHRALTDCIYLVQVFERCGDLEALLAAALQPRLLYRANLPYAERHRAKEAGSAGTTRWPVPGAGGSANRRSPPCPLRCSPSRPKRWRLRRICRGAQLRLRPSSRSRAPFTNCMVSCSPPRSGWCSLAQRFQAWFTSSSLSRPQRGRCRRWRATIASRSGCFPKGPQSALLRAGLRLPPALRFLPFVAPPLPNPFVAAGSVRGRCWGSLLVGMSWLAIRVRVWAAQLRKSR